MLYTGQWCIQSLNYYCSYIQLLGSEKSTRRAAQASLGTLYNNRFFNFLMTKGISNKRLSPFTFLELSQES
jgi:hypothetical protein